MYEHEDAKRSVKLRPNGGLELIQGKKTNIDLPCVTLGWPATSRTKAGEIWGSWILCGVAPLPEDALRSAEAALASSET